MKQIYWELIVAYSLPIILIVLARQAQGWEALIYIIWFVLSTWLSIPLAALSYWRWNVKWHVILYLPLVLFALSSLTIF